MPLSNEEMVEELAKVLCAVGDMCPWDDMSEDGHALYRSEIRAILSKLAEIGPSEEMRLAGAGVDDDPGSDYHAIFTAMLRSLVPSSTKEET